MIGTAQSEKSASGYRAYFKRRAFSRFGVPGADTNHERAEGDNFLVAIPQRNYKHASVTKAACMVTQRRQRATDLCLNLEHNSSVVVGRLAGQKTMAIGPTTQATLTSARALREEQTTTPFEPKPTIPQPQHAPGGLSCYKSLSGSLRPFCNSSGSLARKTHRTRSLWKRRNFFAQITEVSYR